MEFKREERYIVFKVADLGNSLKGDEIRKLAQEYAEHRKQRSKEPLECVVVEKDWPEYEPTWKAIEARVTGAQAQPAPSVPMDVIVDYLVSISALVAHRDDAKAQAEIGELLKMIASAPKPAPDAPDPAAQKRLMSQWGYRYQRCAYPSCESTVGCLGVCHQEDKP